MPCACGAAEGQVWRAQVPTMELLARRPCAVQVVKEVHATSGAPFLDYILADLVALPPEQAPLFVESVLAVPPSMLPNSHSTHYPTSTCPHQLHHVPAECEWPDKRVALLALYEHYKVLLLLLLLLLLCVYACARACMRACVCE